MVDQIFGRSRPAYSGCMFEPHCTHTDASDRELSYDQAARGRPSRNNSEVRYAERTGEIRMEVPTTLSIAAIAEVAALVGDPGRTTMLMALLDGFPLTARQLADRAGVTPQTASGHIAKLHAAGLVRIERRGRTHLHCLGAPRIEQLLEVLAHVAATGSPYKVRRPVPCGDAGIGMARVCRGHLAGRLGVLLARRLCQERTGSLRPEGRSTLLAWGIKPLQLDGAEDAATCLDWSESAPHLAGSVGSAILDRCLQLGWIKRIPENNVLVVTGFGLRGFQSHFGVSVDRGAGC